MAWKELTAKTFASIRELNGISQRTQEEHYELYKAYIGKTNEIQKKLDTVDRSTANQIFSDLRSLRVDLSFAYGGVKNHELFLIGRDFPSYDAWLADFKASGLAARGWVWLAWDHDLGALTTVVGDAQNTFPVWNATPIIAMDVYEHAYWLDYGRLRAKYIEAFFNNLDWAVVEQNLERALAMNPVAK
jgi:Fe-Mn family superoxide dismutase